MMRLVVCLSLVVLLASCGDEATGGQDIPDVRDPGPAEIADVQDPGPAEIADVAEDASPDIYLDVPDEGTDETTPLQVTVQPADGAKGVSVLSAITISLNQTVTSAAGSATALLAWDRGFNETNGYGIEVDGTLAVSGSNVTFTPTAPLAAGMTYRFSLSGLTTAAGVVPATSVRFRTWEDPVAYVVTRTAPDTITQVSVNLYDDDGVLTGTRIYSGAGVDNVWRTDDDVQSSRSDYTEAEGGHWTRHYNYNGAGADAQWGTADDILAYHQLRTFDAHGQNILYDSFSSAGDDTVPFSGDETYSWRQHRMFDEHGLLTRSFQPSSAGPDTEWFTGDDTASAYTVSEYDGAGRLVRRVGHGRGPDNLWFTGDDVVGGYDEYTLLPDGRRERLTEIADPGPDATWFTADDTDKWPTVYEYDAAGLLATETWYDPANKIGGYTEYDHDASGRRTAQRRFDAGPDGTFMTGDDFVQIEWVYVP